MTLLESFNNILHANMPHDILTDIQNYGKMEQDLIAFQNALQNETHDSVLALCKDIYSNSDAYTIHTKVYILSYLAIISNSPLYANELLTLLLHSDKLSIENLFFLYYQILGRNFTNSNLYNSETEELMAHIYKKIYTYYKISLSDSLQFVKKADRNPNLVVVFISQFLGLNHGPTKTILDRCVVIKNQMHKTPFIINTAEFLPSVGFTPFFCASSASYNPELLNNEVVEYQGEKFTFLQCDNTMPNTNDVLAIVNVIKQLKPYCIFNIGGSSITNDICSNIIPTITISTVPSARCVTEGQFQVIGRAITTQDQLWLSQNGKSKNHIIECRFTSSFKQQESKISRQDIGLPKDSFVGLIVGGRLDKELSEDFIQMLCKAMDNDIFIAFMGIYNDYEETVRTHPIFKTHSKFLGFMPDVLAVNECCDLYINPKRIGGGTSVAEALSKGLPAVTLNYGDVGLGAGDEFFVSDYDEMLETIIKYSQNREFYSSMSKKALARADILTNSATEFVKILTVAEQCEEF